jgi:hypothetical protein
MARYHILLLLLCPYGSVSKVLGRIPVVVCVWADETCSPRMKWGKGIVLINQAYTNRFGKGGSERSFYPVGRIATIRLRTAPPVTNLCNVAVYGINSAV